MLFAVFEIPSVRFSVFPGHLALAVTFPVQPRTVVSGSLQIRELDVRVTGVTDSGRRPAIVNDGVLLIFQSARVGFTYTSTYSSGYDSTQLLMLNIFIFKAGYHLWNWSRFVHRLAQAILVSKLDLELELLGRNQFCARAPSHSITTSVYEATRYI